MRIELVSMYDCACSRPRVDEEATLYSKKFSYLRGHALCEENLKLVSESFALPVPTLYVPPSRNIELLILIFVMIYFSLHEFEPEVDRVINYDGSFLGPVLVIPPHLPFLRQLPRPYKIPFSSRPKFRSHDVTHEPNIFLINGTGVRKKFNKKSHFHRTCKEF